LTTIPRWSSFEVEQQDSRESVSGICYELTIIFLLLGTEFRALTAIPTGASGAPGGPKCDFKRENLYVLGCTFFKTTEI